jgi:intein-encoded DNA endonuclease-like protein
VYLLGVLQGDGSVRSHTSLVSLSVRNREFVEAFADGLEKIGLRPHFRSYRHRGKDWYSVQTRSVVFAKWYRGLSISDIAQMAILFPSEYVRGFYESEGYDDGHRGQTLCNSSPEKLELIRRCLLNLGFSTSLVKPYLFPNGKIKNKKTMYRVRIYGGRQQRLNFIEKIKPCIKMKGGDAHAA